MDSSWQLLFDIVLLLAGCLVAGFVVAKLGHNPIIGYLLAGMILGGQGSLQLIKPGPEMDTIAELGVSLLLFSIGIEFSWIRLRTLEKRTWFIGIAQILVTTAVATAIAQLIIRDFRASLALGMMLSLSSTACVLRVLHERAEIDSRSGRTALAILLVQDMAVIPFAIIFTFLSPVETEQGVVTTIWQTLAWLAALIVALYIILTHIALRFMHTLPAIRMRELLILLAVCTGLASAWAAHAIGLSPAIGAFLAGMFLGGSPFATQIRADIASLRVVLLTLFFGTAGMVADPVWIAQHALLVLSVTALVMVGKALLLWGILTIAKMPHPAGVSTSLRLAQVGEFAFVLSTLGATLFIVDNDLQMLVVSVAILTLITSPFIIGIAPTIGIRVGQMIGSTFDQTDAEAYDKRTPPDIIVIGYGPAGQRACVALEQTDQHVLVIELNRAGAAKAERHGFDSLLGDATQHDVLEHARIEHAQTVLITIPSRSTSLTIMDHVRRLAPTARIIVRARYHQHVEDFKQAGAHIVLDDEAQVGDALAAVLRETDVNQP